MFMKMKKKQKKVNKPMIKRNASSHIHSIAKQHTRQSNNKKTRIIPESDNNMTALVKKWGGKVEEHEMYSQQHQSRCESYKA